MTGEGESLRKYSYQRRSAKRPIQTIGEWGAAEKGPRHTAFITPKKLASRGVRGKDRH